MSTAIPDLWPPTTSTFYNFASGDKVTFSWDKKGFQITRESIARTRTLHSFPFTEAGWVQTWQTMVKEYPSLAAKVAERVGGERWELSRLTKHAVVEGCTFLGGRGWSDPLVKPDTPCTLYFTNEGLWARLPDGLGDQTLLRVPYEEIAALEVSGPGEQSALTVANFLMVGLWALTLKNIKTYVRLQMPTAEFFFSCNTEEPNELRMHLSGPIDRIAQLRMSPPPMPPPLKPGSTSTAPVSVADELTKLAALRDSGVLTEEEFSAQKARLLGQP